jgi:hypothetical protein
MSITILLAALLVGLGGLNLHLTSVSADPAGFTPSVVSGGGPSGSPSPNVVSGGGPSGSTTL